MPALKKVLIHTDGACHGNPGPGGWAAVLACGPHRRQLSGAALATTNNRMELQAAIEALAVLKERCSVQLFTDSQYVRKGVTLWVATWSCNGWLTKARKPVKNEDLWRALLALVAKHELTWHWLKGHAGHEENECCDRLAVEEIYRIKKSCAAEQLTAALAEFNVREQTAGRTAPLWQP
jgi:ribonuclease HI